MCALCPPHHLHLRPLTWWACGGVRQVLDVDGDGYLGVKDMWYFYEELQSRLEAMDEERVTFEEIVNEFMDMVKPARRGFISLSELKRCQLGCAPRRAAHTQAPTNR